jgi:hypothetical protein
VGARRNTALQKPIEAGGDPLQIFAQIVELGLVAPDQFLEVVVIGESRFGIDFEVREAGYSPIPPPSLKSRSFPMLRLFGVRRQVPMR